MTKIRKNLIQYRDLTEDQKDDILEYIREEEVSIKKAALDLDLTTSTIDKIFAQRYSKEVEVKSRTEYHKKYWQENKHK